MISVNTNSKHGRLFDIPIKETLNSAILDCRNEYGTTANNLVYNPLLIRGLNSHVKRIESSTLVVDQGAAAFVVLMGEDKGLYRLTLVSTDSMPFNRLSSTHKWIWCWTSALYSRCQKGEGERQQDGQLHDCEYAIADLIFEERDGLGIEDCENGYSSKSIE